MKFKYRWFSLVLMQVINTILCFNNFGIFTWQWWAIMISVFFIGYPSIFGKKE